MDTLNLTLDALPQAVQDLRVLEQTELTEVAGGLTPLGVND